MVFLTKRRACAVLKTSKEHGLEHDFLMFLILSYTGIRVGELVALNWKDIDFLNHTINITKTYYNPNNNTGIPAGYTKTRKSRRKIIVDEVVINTLKEHKEFQEEVIKRFGDAYYNKGFIFAKMER